MPVRLYHIFVISQNSLYLRRVEMKELLNINVFKE